MTLAIASPLVALIVTMVLTAVVRDLALRAGRLSEARSDRWHKRPTPNVGGIAIVLGFGAAVLFAWLASGAPGQPMPADRALVPWAPWTGLLVAVFGVSLVGLVDDFVQLRPIPKLLGQLAAASVLLLSGIGVWLTGIHVLDVVISLFWFVGITNALNLLDNMDGLAAGIGAIAATFLGITFLLAGESEFGILAFTFAGALGGFLVLNYPPARIFMGDSGSLFIGLFLAGLALSPAPGLSRSLFAVVAIPLAVLSIPILDTTFVTVTRLFEGRSVSTGGRDHTSHGLVALGVSEKRAVWLLWSLAAAGGVVGLVVRGVSRTVAYPLGGLMVVALMLFGAYLLTQRMQRVEAGQVSEEGQAVVYNRFRDWHHRVPVLLATLDIAIVAVAYYLAYLIRWDASQLVAELPYFRRTVAIVVVLKLFAFSAAGVYRPHLRFYSAADGVSLLRGNVLGWMLTASVLLLVARSGLSRGVLLIDPLVCLILMAGVRLSFRSMEGARHRWSERGRAAAVLGGLDDARVAFSALRGNPDVRPVCVVDRHYPTRTGRFRGHPVFGGSDGLRRAIDEHDLHTVVVVESQGDGSTAPDLDAYLNEVGALDVYRLRISLESERP